MLRVYGVYGADLYASSGTGSFTSPLADRSDVLVRSLEATLVNMQKATEPLAERAANIVRALEAFFANVQALMKATVSGRLSFSCPS